MVLSHPPMTTSFLSTKISTGPATTQEQVTSLVSPIIQIHIAFKEVGPFIQIKSPKTRGIFFLSDNTPSNINYVILYNDSTICPFFSSSCSEPSNYRDIMQIRLEQSIGTNKKFDSQNLSFFELLSCYHAKFILNLRLR